ncbi:hypothetical protein [Anabaena sphaerica]|nr:hypothetical protein [Anabaena sphaerica]
MDFLCSYGAIAEGLSFAYRKAQNSYFVMDLRQLYYLMELDN